MIKSLDFFFDFASPYGFLAARKLSALAENIGRDINWRPFLIGVVYQAHGSTPLSHPLKEEYMFTDAFRRAKLDGIERMNKPENFPAHSVPPSRLTYWIEREAPDRVSDFVVAAYQAYWTGGGDTSDMAAALDVAEALGFDRQKALAGMESPEIKGRLRAVTDEALERGVFGSPFILIDDQPYWGGDRFADIETLHG
ncbi:2-hydroxychromene-2-carboxylate isomerase [Phaeobacter sp. CECT 5382]|uniref:2-hydroxychromene-2-carboxylate isomerase n=1 Tax=Phaeobacter sp. CECT 5382 TaxID=1712645 RepID=UPI0006DACA62|nr:2-hydroxychromene-2-carboxylate isomerase [Phaeobacter sp. CECT 5382]CUH88053.1 2-hydroxychromene-2-carboxylate isomerase [Phaeobacter sp. CECT 5382]